MDGSTPGTNPPFDAQRWRRQFAVAHLKDLVRDWQNPQPGPEEVLAAMRAAPVAPLQGEPFGVGMGALLKVDPGLVRSGRGRDARRYVKKSEMEEAYDIIRNATGVLDTLSIGACSGCEDLAENVLINKAACEKGSGCTFSLSGCKFENDGAGQGRCVCNYTCLGADCKSQIKDGSLQGACQPKMIEITALPTGSASAGGGVAIGVRPSVTEVLWSTCADSGGMYHVPRTDEQCDLPYYKNLVEEGECTPLCHERQSAPAWNIDVDFDAVCTLASSKQTRRIAALYAEAVRLSWLLLLTYADVAVAATCAVMGAKAAECVKARLDTPGSTRVRVTRSPFTSPTYNPDTGTGGVEGFVNGGGVIELYCSSGGNGTHLGRWVINTAGQEGATLTDYSSGTEDGRCLMLHVASVLLHELAHICGAAADGLATGHDVVRAGDCSDAYRIDRLFAELVRPMAGLSGTYCKSLGEG